MPDRVEALSQVPMLSGLGRRQLAKLARKARDRHFAEGTLVVEEGTMSGVGFFVIVSGEASVRSGDAEVARLGPGGHFGELALIAERERTATVRAETDLECVELAMWDFREFVQSDPDVSWKLLEHVVGLLLDQQSAG